LAEYRLQFLRAAKQEWDKLDGSVQTQFIKVLSRRLEQPRVPMAALVGMADCYKIKLRATGYRLVYQVRDQTLVLLTIAVGKRERNAVYAAAMARLASADAAQSSLERVPPARNTPPAKSGRRS
jgi:mRNA interferase RelE/StbE